MTVLHFWAFKPDMWTSLDHGSLNNSHQSTMNLANLQGPWENGKKCKGIAVQRKPSFLSRKFLLPLREKTGLLLTEVLSLFKGHVCLLSHSAVSHSAVTPWTVARQAPPSVGFSRQEHRSGLPFLPPGNPPDPGIEPTSPAASCFGR